MFIDVSSEVFTAMYLRISVFWYTDIISQGESFPTLG